MRPSNASAPLVTAQRLNAVVYVQAKFREIAEARAQVETCRRECARRDLRIRHVLVDDPADCEAPGLSRLIRLVTSRRAKVIVTIAPSRVATNIQTLLRLVEQYGDNSQPELIIVPNTEPPHGRRRVVEDADSEPAECEA